VQRRSCRTPRRVTARGRIANLGRLPIRFKLLAFLLIIAAGIIGYHYYASRRKVRSAEEVAYVLPASLQVVDTPGEIRLAVESVKAGDRVQVLLRARNWAKVKLQDGRTGWVECKDIVDAQAYDGSQKLLKDLENLPVQAEGHAPQSINLRFEPSRDAASVAQLPNNQKLQVYGRKIVERPPPSADPSSPTVKEAWYLVKADTRAGWVLGRSVTLDIPQPISANAQGYNLVAWMVLNTVADNGRQVPQYLTADRTGNQDVDFTHIRIFTWWVKNQQYVTSYAESGLRGYFPIRVTQNGKVPQFRLNLLDENGNQVQKVYALFDTITRPQGFVVGWNSNSPPSRPPARRAPRRR